MDSTIYISRNIFGSSNLVKTVTPFSFNFSLSLSVFMEFRRNNSRATEFIDRSRIEFSSKQFYINIIDKNSRDKLISSVPRVHFCKYVSDRRDALRSTIRIDDSLFSFNWFSLADPTKIATRACRSRDPEKEKKKRFRSFSPTKTIYLVAVRSIHSREIAFPRIVTIVYARVQEDKDVTYGRHTVASL